MRTGRRGRGRSGQSPKQTRNTPKAPPGDQKPSRKHGHVHCKSLQVSCPRSPSPAALGHFLLFCPVSGHRPHLLPGAADALPGRGHRPARSCPEEDTCARHWGPNTPSRPGGPPSDHERLKVAHGLLPKTQAAATAAPRSRRHAQSPGPQPPAPAWPAARSQGPVCCPGARPRGEERGPSCWGEAKGLFLVSSR